MKGCSENGKKIPVVSFPKSKEYWKGFEDYVRDNISLRKLKGYLINQPMKEFILKGTYGFRYEVQARKRGGYEVLIGKEGTPLKAEAIFLPSDDGVLFRVLHLEGAPKCERLREQIEILVAQDLYIMFHTNEALPGSLLIDEEDRV